MPDNYNSLLNLLTLCKGNIKWNCRYVSKLDYSLFCSSDQNQEALCLSIRIINDYEDILKNKRIGNNMPLQGLQSMQMYSNCPFIAEIQRTGWSREGTGGTVLFQIKSVH